MFIISWHSGKLRWTAFSFELLWYRNYDLIAGVGDEREVVLVTEANEGATTEGGLGELTEGVVAEADQGGPRDTEEAVVRDKKEVAVARYAGDTRIATIVATEKRQGENVPVRELSEEASVGLRAGEDPTRVTRIMTIGVNNHRERQAFQKKKIRS